MEFNEDGTLDVLMITYLKNLIADFPELIHRKAATSASGHLFQVRDKKDAKPLCKEQVLVFHHMVMQLLFMAVLDIQTAVAFLTTRVKSPDEDKCT